MPGNIFDVKMKTLPEREWGGRGAERREEKKKDEEEEEKEEVAERVR